MPRPRHAALLALALVLVMALAAPAVAATRVTKPESSTTSHAAAVRRCEAHARKAVRVAKARIRSASVRRSAATVRRLAARRAAVKRACLVREAAARAKPTAKKPPATTTTPTPAPAPAPAPEPAPAPTSTTPTPTAPAPALSVSGTTLRWAAISGISRYVLATIPDGDRTRTSYSTVTGTSVTPAAAPGHTVRYGLRADVDGSAWADEVSIAYPADTAAPTTSTTSTTTTTPTPPPSTTPADTSLAIGISANAMAWSQPGEVIDRVKATGAGWLREEFDWDEIESTRGTYNWSRPDRTMAAAAARGMHVLPMIMSTPSWAGATWSTLTNGTDYGRFVAAVVARYGTKGSFWAANPTLPKVPTTYYELWNEPYESFFSAGGINPGLYARMAATATDAGRAADPSARFLLEATFKSFNGSTFVDAMYAAVPDLNAHFDGVAIHPYGVDATSASGQFRRTMEDTRARFVAHGASDKPFWLTEVGWATCPGTDSYCVSEARQAQLLTDEFRLFKTTYASYVRAVIVYQLNDHYTASPNPNDSQDWYGLTRRDDSRKPAYAALLAVTAG